MRRVLSASCEGNAALSRDTHGIPASTYPRNEDEFLDKGYEKALNCSIFVRENARAVGIMELTVKDLAPLLSMVYAP